MMREYRTLNANSADYLNCAYLSALVTELFI